MPWFTNCGAHIVQEYYTKVTPGCFFI